MADTSHSGFGSFSVETIDDDEEVVEISSEESSNESGAKKKLVGSQEARSALQKLKDLKFPAISRTHKITPEVQAWVSKITSSEVVCDSETDSLADFDLQPLTLSRPKSPSVIASVSDEDAVGANVREADAVTVSECSSSEKLLCELTPIVATGEAVPGSKRLVSVVIESTPNTQGQVIDISPLNVDASTPTPTCAFAKEAVQLTQTVSPSMENFPGRVHTPTRNSTMTKSPWKTSRLSLKRRSTDDVVLIDDDSNEKSRNNTRIPLVTLESPPAETAPPRPKIPKETTTEKRPSKQTPTDKTLSQGPKTSNYSYKKVHTVVKRTSVTSVAAGNSEKPQKQTVVRSTCKTIIKSPLEPNDATGAPSNNFQEKSSSRGVAISSQVPPTTPQDQSKPTRARLSTKKSEKLATTLQSSPVNDDVRSEVHRLVEQVLKNAGAKSTEERTASHEAGDTRPRQILPLLGEGIASSVAQSQGDVCIILSDSE